MGDRLLIVDQAYGEFADEDVTPILLRQPNVVVIRTLSKAYGLAGLRIGIAIGSPVLVDWMRTVGHPYPVAGPSLAIARKVFGVAVSARQGLMRIAPVVLAPVALKAEAVEIALDGVALVLGGEAFEAGPEGMPVGDLFGRLVEESGQALRHRPPERVVLQTFLQVAGQLALGEQGLGHALVGRVLVVRTAQEAQEVAFDVARGGEDPIAADPQHDDGRAQVPENTPAGHVQACFPLSSRHAASSSLLD
ncbi:MAG: aminotransferase class I/II-fold pyridoxal phosphate-dependent enzyme [Limibacillus sp.]